MAGYSVDRARLEGLPTAEIQRILREEQDDYTPEALDIFRDILESRGDGLRSQSAKEAVSMQTIPRHNLSGHGADHLIQSPGDAVVMLNDILRKLLDGELDPHVAQSASQVVMSILRAMEQDYLTELQEEP